MSQAILVLNAGSSSIKFSVYDVAGQSLAMRYDGQVEGIGTQPNFIAKDASGAVLTEVHWDHTRGGSGHTIAFAKLTDWLDERLGESTLIGVGHRVVHGGPDYSAPVRITMDLFQALKNYIPLAPLHQPHNLAGIQAVLEMRPNLPQVACFDTAFHRTNAQVVEQFGLPFEFYDEGVRRYGFHGMSYEYIASALPDIAPEVAAGRVVVAHLGNGASMCALHQGRSVASTMGFTALDGLPMGTRCGSIDPGVLLYLMQEKGMDAPQIEALLYKRSGLLGMSGVSNDMRQLMASNDPRATQALDYFVYRIGRELGSLAAALGGLDALVFTAGIGENAPAIRARVCHHAAWLGVNLDEDANQRRESRISTAHSRVSVWVIPTDEEQMIARHTLNTLR